MYTIIWWSLKSQDFHRTVTVESIWVDYTKWLMPQNTMDVDSQFNQLGSTCPLSVIWICIFPGRLSIWYDIRRYNDYYSIITYMNAATFLLNIYLTIDPYLFLSFSLLSFCMHAYPFLLLCTSFKEGSFVPSTHVSSNRSPVPCLWRAAGAEGSDVACDLGTSCGGWLGPLR